MLQEFDSDPAESAYYFTIDPIDNPLTKMADVVHLHGETIKLAYRVWDKDKHTLLFKYNEEIRLSSNAEAEKLFHKIVRWISHCISAKSEFTTIEVNYVYDVLRALKDSKGAGRVLFDMIPD